MHFYEISVIYRRNYQRFDKEIIMVSNHYTIALLIFSLHLFFFHSLLRRKCVEEVVWISMGLVLSFFFFFKWINCRANFVHRLYTYIDIDRNIFEHRNDYNRMIITVWKSRRFWRKFYYYL